MATTGRAAFDVKVTGLADQPLVDGRMSIDNGGLVVREPRLAITDLQGTVTFARDALQFGNITANANGGTLRVTGSIQYPKFAIAGGSIEISGRGLAVEVPEDLRTEIDTDLRLDLSEKAPTLAGSLTVLRGSYREPVSLAAQLLTGVQTQSAVAASTTEAGFFDRVLLDIDVKTAEALVLDNNYGRLDVAANLRIVGTVAEPVPTGRLTIGEGGNVFLGGRTYDVVRGTVDFTSATRVEPTIDLALQTRVASYDCRGRESDRHLVDRYLDVLIPLGVKKADRIPHLKTRKADNDSVEQILTKAKVAPGAPLVGLFPGAGHPGRRWPLEKFADLADYLIRNDGVQSIGFCRTRRTRPGSRKCVTFFRQTTLILDRLTIPQLAAALARLAVFVSNDTGPMHIAVAVGTPVVALLDRPTPNSFVPIEDHHRVMYGQTIKEITTDEVYEVARELLTRNRMANILAGSKQQ